MRLLVAIVTTILLATTPLQASAKTGLEILEAIEKSKDMRNMMHLYLMGVTDGLHRATIAFNEDAILCIPGDATNKQMALIVEKYLKENPEELHEDIVTLAYYAMIDAYPCEDTEENP